MLGFVSHMGIKVDQEPHSTVGTAAPAAAAVPPAAAYTRSEPGFGCTHRVCDGMAWVNAHYYDSELNACLTGTDHISVFLCCNTRGPRIIRALEIFLGYASPCLMDLFTPKI
jgi:hypothetical protein